MPPDTDASAAHASALSFKVLYAQATPPEKKAMVERVALVIEKQILGLTPYFVVEDTRRIRALVDAVTTETRRDPPPAGTAFPLAAFASKIYNRAIEMAIYAGQPTGVVEPYRVASQTMADLAIYIKSKIEPAHHKPFIPQGPQG